MRPASEPMCPCRAREAQARRYLDCCGRWHAGLVDGEHAPTAEALMRSRYSAYALVQGRAADRPPLLDYLRKTWHPTTVPAGLDPGPVQWTGLDLLHHETIGDAAVVSFVAHHKVNGRAARLHEASRFVREDGRWLYLDGVESPDAAA